MAELSRHISEHVNVINVFHDVNSILYTVTNTHPDTGIIPRFCSANYSGETMLRCVEKIIQEKNS